MSYLNSKNMSSNRERCGLLAVLVLGAVSLNTITEVNSGYKSSMSELQLFRGKSYAVEKYVKITRRFQQRGFFPSPYDYGSFLAAKDYIEGENPSQDTIDLAIKGLDNGTVYSDNWVSCPDG